MKQLHLEIEGTPVTPEFPCFCWKNQMIISNSRKFIFVHNYKTAGEAITQALTAEIKWCDIELGSTAYGARIEPVYRSRFGLWKHSPAESIRAVVGDEVWQRYVTFAVVRDPYARTRSLYDYLERIAKSRGWRRHLVGLSSHLRARSPWNWPMMQIYRTTPSFSAFIRHPEFGRTGGTMPQIRLIGDAAGTAPIVDHVLRFENLAGEFAQLCTVLGLEGLTLPTKNKTKPGSGSTWNGRTEWLTDADRAVLADVYRRDFEVFGYAA